MWEDGEGGVFEEFFLEESLMGKGVINFWMWGFRVFRDSNSKFYTATLTCFTFYVQAERFCISCYFSLKLLASSY